MNFLAGLILLFARDEALAFKFMHCIIERNELQNLYVQNVPLLKENFYSLDRLIFMHHPDISAFFRTEGVSSNLFASNWIMTIFAQSAQYTKNDQPTPMVIKIWDRFVLDGWKAVFKAALFVIEELKEKIVGARFDRVVAAFSEFTKTKCLHDEAAAKKFEERYKELKVTNSILKKLSREYKSTYNSIIEYLEKIELPKTDSTNYKCRLFS
eukprot:TRINITY_DN7029_c0_g2_i1.p1 TRINITY_DN7029_c0_g2~~TRINITY_DN7029_c0_g2_i1.p1  ORF type:complete len:211 (+),score=48.94 TRINITY_DN7029_c0_g2_i1:857-1489(+)